MGKLPIRSMLNSKRFIATVVATVLFVTLIYTTEFAPLELAGAITMLLGVYLGVETYKPSDKY